MLCILNIDDDLEILTDEEMKHFVAINFSKCFKSIKEKENIRKVAKPLYIFLKHLMNQKNMFNTKPVIKCNCIAQYYNFLVLV